MNTCARGCPVPTTDTFISLWLAERRNPASGELPVPELGGTMLERLRNDDFTPKLLPLAVSRPGVSLDMSSFHYLRDAMGLPRMMEISQVGAFISLAAEGTFGREQSLMEPPAPFWAAQLPHHRDEMVARDYTKHSNSGWRRQTRVLPFVAEADGPAGYAVHIALARGMAHGTQVDDATVDALLVLAARGQLDTGLLGRQLETLLRAGMIVANRVAASLRAAAETGAYGTVWAVIEAALPGLLRDTPLREAALFLSLAVECVARCGAKGEIAGVVAAAERGGSSQTAKNARLLRDALR